MSTEEKKETGKSDERRAQLEEIKDMGSVAAFDGKHKIYCLTVIGEIEGHSVLPEQNKTTKYEHVIPQLVAIEESREIEGLLVVLNTVGGDVEAGLAIAELISGMKKPTVSYVLGGGHSIGVPLAVSAKRSYIAPSATMTVHPVRLNGMVVGVPQTFAYFDRIQERIIRFVSENSKISAEEYRKLMTATGGLMTDVGTLLGGREAVESGLIDALGGLKEALKKLDEMIAEEESKC